MASDDFGQKIRRAMDIADVQLHEWGPDRTIVPIPNGEQNRYFRSYTVALADSPSTLIELDSDATAEMWAAQLAAAKSVSQ